jgi:predicted nucleotidyltransferase
MRAEAAGQSALLMVDVAAILAARGMRYAVIGAMAAAVHGVVRASLDADAVVGARVSEARELQSDLTDKGFTTELRIGDAEDPIPALLAVTDRFGNRVDLLIGLRGLDAGAMDRAKVVTLSGFRIHVIGREDFVAMKAHAGGPVDLADARAVIEIDPAGLDRDLVRRVADGFGRDASERVKALLDGIA